MTPPRQAPISEAVDAQKNRKGVLRMLHATRYSIAGLKAGWTESALRQEFLCAFILIPASFVIGSSWVEIALLTGSVILLIVIELLNTAMETTLDRIGSEWNALTKRAKDMGSAAVLLTLIWCGGIWLAALFRYFS